MPPSTLCDEALDLVSSSDSTEDVTFGAHEAPLASPPEAELRLAAGRGTYRDIRALLRGLLAVRKLHGVSDRDSEVTIRLFETSTGITYRLSTEPTAAPLKFDHAFDRVVGTSNRYPNLSAAIERGEVIGKNLPTPGHRTLRALESPIEDLPLDDQVSVGRRGLPPVEHIRRPRL